MVIAKSLITRFIFLIYIQSVLLTMINKMESLGKFHMRGRVVFLVRVGFWMLTRANKIWSFDTTVYHLTRSVASIFCILQFTCSLGCWHWFLFFFIVILINIVFSVISIIVIFAFAVKIGIVNWSGRGFWSMALQRGSMSLQCTEQCSLNLNRFTLILATISVKLDNFGICLDYLGIEYFEGQTFQWTGSRQCNIGLKEQTSVSIDSNCLLNTRWLTYPSANNVLSMRITTLSKVIP
jgi:hypothetical protein